MEHREGQFSGERGARIWFQAWRPAAPRGVVVIAHGLGEHSGRYKNLANWLVPRGYALYALDHRGHGHSSGYRGHVDRFGDYVADLGRLVDQAQAEEPGLPLFVLGHSLGGAIALAYALERPQGLRGVVASAPGLRRRSEVPWFKVLLGQALSRLWPTFTHRSGLPVNGLSHDPQVALDYVADRLVHDRVSARLFTEAERAGEEVLANAGGLCLPCLLLQGDEDQLVDAQATVEFYERAAGADKALRVYPGFYHEGLNEMGRERPLGDLADWLDAHVE
ncbi:MAG TPA: lysophospholipase [Anaerolineae bacterium]|nr:lysophospholipase [Anaerolineae bacterium]HOQ99667.1 lysophospholipase [Anaerolineae bacterium]HPL26747.1 lysophospholipase [Anaerolineae bacterium]